MPGWSHARERSCASAPPPPGRRRPRPSACRATARLGSERLHRFQDLVDVTWHLHFAPEATNHTLPVDEECRAVHPHVFAAIHAFLDPDAILLGDRGVFIGGERERQLVFLLELVVRGGAVLGDADHGSAGLAEIGQCVAEAAGLSGAAAGVVLRIEVEDHRLALELLQRDLAIAVGRHCEIGRLVADREAHAISSSVISVMVGSVMPSRRRARDAARMTSFAKRRCTNAALALISDFSRSKSIALAPRTSISRSAGAAAVSSKGSSTVSFSRPWTLRQRERARSSFSAVSASST